MVDINNNAADRGSSTAWILGLVVIVLLVLFLIFLWPTLAGNDAARDTANEDRAGDTNNTILPSPVTNNTIINATTSINNSTTTDD